MHVKQLDLYCRGSSRVSQGLGLMPARALVSFYFMHLKEIWDNANTVCGSETMNHGILSLFSILHFPVTLLFPEAAETAKRQLLFERWNIEKVRVVQHNATIHWTCSLLKFHCFILMTKATEHNRKQSNIIARFQEQPERLWFAS